jgi:hypothetical protein
MGILLSVFVFVPSRRARARRRSYRQTRGGASYHRSAEPCAIAGSAPHLLAEFPHTGRKTRDASCDKMDLEKL